METDTIDVQELIEGLVLAILEIEQAETLQQAKAIVKIKIEEMKHYAFLEEIDESRLH